MRVRRIIYFHLGGLGDCIHDLSALSQLVSCYPNARVYYICKTHANSLIKHSYLDKKISTITVDNFFDVIKAIFKTPFRADYFIVGCGSNIAKVNIFKKFLFPRISGASLPDYPDQKLINFWTKASTFSVLLQPIKGAHRVFTNWSLMDLMGIKGDMHQPKLNYSKISNIQLPQDINKIINTEYLVVHHGAASLDSLKHFNDSKFSDIINTVIQKYDLNVVLVGGMQEVSASKRIFSLCKSSEHILDLTGKLSLSQLMKVIFNSKLVLGTDSGPGHIAAALSVPTVSLFGPTDPRQCSPLTRNGYVVRQPVKCSPCYLSDNFAKCTNNVCMQSISVFSVVQAISIVIDGTNYADIEEKYNLSIENCPSTVILQ